MFAIFVIIFILIAYFAIRTWEDIKRFFNNLFK